MTEGARILIVDDERDILRALRINLSARGYDVLTAENGEDALQLFASRRPDLLLLDLTMPGMNGLDLIQQLRQHSAVPIIVLSIHDSQRDKVTALDAGADDYVTKPFDVEELLARIRTALRHVAPFQPTGVFERWELRVDFERRTVSLHGKQVHLTPTEYDLLKTLISHAGKALMHQMLLREVWRDQYGVDPHYLHVFIGQLRRKLEVDPRHPRFILTEPGIGYRFCPD